MEKIKMMVYLKLSPSQIDNMSTHEIEMLSSLLSKFLI